MRICSPVVLSYFDGGFEPRWGRKDFLTACCCCLLLLLLKRVAQPWPLSRLELGPSWVLVLRNAWEFTVEERPLPLEMCLHGYGDGPETRLNNGSFSPQNGPPRGTMAWYTPY